ncbi:MAG: response regulator transcription factor [Deltaproteobacteria bacterium]|nr:response regulator transcription factor [Deltaproteobacteria bacterium]
MRILVVEDQIEIVRNIAEYLEIKGYLVDCAYDGLGGLHLAVTGNYDLIVLDLVLPGMDGITLSGRLRQESRIYTPIIMLTARDGVDDKLAGFKAGADDYLVKPFSLQELQARIEAVLRRSKAEFGCLLEVGDLRFDLDNLIVRRRGNSLKINPIGLKLLEKLMRASPNVVRKETLEELLWGEIPPDSDSLRSHIHLLRQTIDKPFEKPLLHTVHGIGYCLRENKDGI